MTCRNFMETDWVNNDITAVSASSHPADDACEVDLTRPLPRLVLGSELRDKVNFKQILSWQTVIFIILPLNKEKSVSLTITSPLFLTFQSLDPCRAAMIKSHRMGGLNWVALFSHNSGAWKSKIKVSVGLVSFEASFLGLQVVHSCSVFVWPFLCAHTAQIHVMCPNFLFL